MKAALLLLALPAALVAAKKELKITEIDTPDDCYDKAERGDVAYVLHEGYYRDQQIDTNPDGEDGNPEPLRVVLGKGNILTGMEAAITGMCVGQHISAEIPPHMAYDDKSKNFKHKPVPKGATVTYKLRLIKLEHPGTMGYTVSNLTNKPEVALPFFGILLLLILGAYKANGSAAADTKASKKAAKKAKKKRK